MPLIKLNNRSIKDVTSLPFGVGTLVHIQSQTASNSASISFTTGINSTYKEYQFYFINIRPATDGTNFRFQGSTNGGSSYGVTTTSTVFRAYHNEADSATVLEYETGDDQAQETDYTRLGVGVGNASDKCLTGTFSLFNPASTTYVKHFIATTQLLNVSDFSINYNTAGYLNTTSAVNAIDFKFESGNIADGTIAMFGVL
jgi:hypothetical protein